MNKNLNEMSIGAMQREHDLNGTTYEISDGKLVAEHPLTLEETIKQNKSLIKVNHLEKYVYVPAAALDGHYAESDGYYFMNAVFVDYVYDKEGHSPDSICGIKVSLKSSDPTEVASVYVVTEDAGDVEIECDEIPYSLYASIFDTLYGAEKIVDAKEFKEDYPFLAEFLENPNSEKFNEDYDEEEFEV